MKNKTVYILGAGSSYSANIPLQKDILKIIYSITLKRFDARIKKKNILNLEIDSDEDALSKNFHEFNKNRIAIGEFILKLFSNEKDYQYYKNILNYIDNIKDDSSKPNSIRNRYMQNAFDKVIKCNVSLEDIFTIFDIFATNKQYINIFTDEEIYSLNRKLQMCIVYAISYNIFLFFKRKRISSI